MSKRPWKKEHHAHMKMRQRQNLVNCKKSDAEQWMLAKLKKTGHKWKRQAQWGWRLFDFWNYKLGIAVEVDGPEHDKALDAERDMDNWEVSRILVIRVRNFNEADAKAAIEKIANAETWNDRRAAAGLKLIRIQ